MKNKREIGTIYEDIAKEYLISKGIKFVEKNYYSKYGEIDLIFCEEEEHKDNKTLIFVEVKYRKSTHYGTPIEMVNKSKIEKILLTSQVYLTKIKWKYDIRYDVIGITVPKKNNELVYDINWIKNAF